MMVATIDTEVAPRRTLLGAAQHGAACRCRRARRDAAGARFPGILNALYGRRPRTPALFPGGKDPGATAMKQTIGQLIGLPIDYYVMVDFRGFYGLVDALGGVTLNVPEAVLDRVSPVRGGRRLDPDRPAAGPPAPRRRPGLRVRAGALRALDYARIKRQRCVIAALADAAGPTTVLRSFRGLTKTFRENFSTDIPAKHLPALAKLADLDPHEPGRLDRLHAAGVHLRRHGDRRRDARHPGHPHGRPRCAQEAAREDDPRTIGGGACS